MRHIVILYFLLVCLPNHHHLLLASPSSPSISCHPDQRQALLRFTHSFSITGPSSPYCLGITSYPKVASWREDEDCCSWDGVTCDNSTGDVIGLDLTCAGLCGSLHSNSSLFSLRRLRRLSLSGNDLLGSTVPPEIGELTQLEYFALSDSNFTGPVPNSIGNLSQLTYLDLSSKWDIIHEKNFTCEFDLRLFSTMENLYFLDLSGVSVSGVDANHEFSFPRLKELFMWRCNLSKFPSFFSRSKELRLLDLRGNKIQEIPVWLWSIGIDTLESLYLDDNDIRGSIPPSICRLTSLSGIYLTGNHLTDVIPGCIGNLTKLQELSLSNNSFSGHLPPSLANCTYLSRLDIDHNSISGAPPTWLSTSSIFSINLRANNFVGRWPADMFLRSTSLFTIDLSDNNFEGPLPLPPYYTTFYFVSNNHFSGEISSQICNATNLEFLDLSNNSLMGTLPDCLKNVTVHLQYLNLRENEFWGQIPDIFQEKSWLRLLDLSRNRFEGSLPRSLSNCDGLEALDLGSNNIVDSFPDWLGDLPLKVLSLRSNHFHGHVIISKETHNFSEIRILDLYNNHFEGNVPDKFIDELFGMRQYNDRDFPTEYMVTDPEGGQGYYLVMIDFKGTEMELGKINSQFAMLDLSSNQFQGEIPKSIGLLKLLKELNFSHNRFTGMIPPSIGNLTYLDSLDLSSNHLTGGIPKELVKLTFLGTLDLSRNNLTGPIPLEGHFNTFSNSSFQGNPGLCGIPLTRLCGQGNKEAHPPSEGKDGGEEEGGGWLEWKYVAMGFGSGMGIGISLGYMVLEMGRPLGLVRLVMRLEASYKKMSKRKKGKGDQRRNGRR